MTLPLLFPRKDLDTRPRLTVSVSSKVVANDNASPQDALCLLPTAYCLLSSPQLRLSRIDPRRQPIACDTLRSIIHAALDHAVEE